MEGSLQDETSTLRENPDIEKKKPKKKHKKTPTYLKCECCVLITTLNFFKRMGREAPENIGWRICTIVK